MARRKVNLATLEEAAAARRANEDLFERMGAYAIEMAGSGNEHELTVRFDSEPLPHVPATVRAPGRADVRVRAKRTLPSRASLKSGRFRSEPRLLRSLAVDAQAESRHRAIATVRRLRMRAGLRPHLAAFMAAASLLVTACQPIAAPSAVPAVTATSVAKTVKIVSSLPLQGGSRLDTVPIVNAIKMALEEQGGKAGRTIVQHESWDDASAERQNWDPEVETANARRAAADPLVVAYIGTYNSGAARLSVPITCQANLAMVSPTNTYPGLTKPYDKDEPGKYYPNCKRNFARVIPTDDLQGGVAARWAKELGAKRVYILHDAHPVVLYGRVAADAFRAEAKRIGLEEAGYDAAPKANDFRALASKVAASGADFVYYGGDGSGSPGVLIRDLKLAKPSISLMGPDALKSLILLREAGASALNTYITSCCVEVPYYTGKPKEWADRYKAKYGDSPTVYAIYGYEATKIVLAAIAKAGVKADDRVTLRDLVMATKGFDGALGTWSFDENGDTSLVAMSGLKVTKIGADFESSVEFQKQLR